MTYRSLLLILFFCQVSYQGKTQDSTIKLTGTVYLENGTPLPGMIIKIEGTQWGTVSDENGHFGINNLVPGKYIVSCTSMGYIPQTKEVNIQAGQPLIIDFQMKENGQELNEITVIGKTESTLLRESAKAVTVVDTKEAKLQTADLGEVLGTVSGVNVQKSGGLGSQNRFSLNGLTDDQIRFMLDGIPLDMMGYSSGIANVPVNLVERIEIYKGVVPVDLGTDALGGAVNLVSSSINDGGKGALSYQTGSFGTQRISIEGQSNMNDKGIFVRGSGYYDYAKNNYLVDVEVAGDGGKLSNATVPRFHDSYENYGIRGTVGWANQSWTDEFSLELFTNKTFRDIQNNNVMSIVYGKVTSQNTTNGALLRYRKDRKKGISVNFASGYSHDQVSFQDTSRYIYTWHGDMVRKSNGEPRERSPGELGQATDRLVWNHNTYARLRMEYPLNAHHLLRVSSAPTYVSRSGDERWDEENETIDPLSEVSTLFTWVNGLEYRFHSENDKLENNFFAKHYLQRVRAEEPTSTLGVTRNKDRESNNFGIGNSLRYLLNEQWMFKASYEWATRLPRPEEIFGNGRLILPNLSLNPERSHNANLAVHFSSPSSSPSSWKFSVNGFLRATDHLILLLGNNEVFSYQNVFAAHSLGLEIDALWQSTNERIQISANTTLQDFRNKSSGGDFAPYAGDRIPNRPYFFINNSIGYNLPDLFRANDNLHLFLKNRYVHEFFKGWESVGLKKFKAIIPSQFTQHVGATYQKPVMGLKTSLTAEVSNLTNSKVYDFFGVQKPGRAYYIKITISF
ncbi:TonB-dependent receptor [Echinicola sp. 20G]|uniref:TonB-dependent receptor n=1 Tax=Echinicola sp. 20G TaxID=2781961 RepID=UPI00190FF937|nr:TonB-dependent receptor [Echinicola sp. 20G]